MKWIEELSKLRNELYEDLPKGETTAWELLSLIKVHINDLDSFINRNSASLPVTGESEAIGERKFTLKEIREAFCHTYNVGKAFPGNNKNKDEKQYFKQTFGIDI